MMKAKKYSISIIIAVPALLIVFALFTIIIDPYFHFHAPINGMSYSFSEEIYVNNGILRHFDYNGIIIGTSMTQNFKTSEADKLFDRKFVKTPFSGESYRGISQHLATALSSNDNVKTVIWGLDASRVFDDKDILRHDEYPDYLYDEDPFNDVNYVLNKDVFFKEDLSTITYSLGGYATTDFDSYSNWNDLYEYGKQEVFKRYERLQKTNESKTFEETHKQIIKGNIEQNVGALVNRYNSVDFYIFIPPYSVCYFDDMNQKGELDFFLKGLEYQTQLLLEYDNVHVFGFFNNAQLICNLDNYKDTIHYGEWVNSWILECINKDEFRLTKSNYIQYYEEIDDYYLNYDYEAIYS